MVLEPVVYRVAERSFHGHKAYGAQGRRVPGVLVKALRADPEELRRRAANG
jgi:hypothetical protein